MKEYYLDYLERARLVKAEYLAKHAELDQKLGTITEKIAALGIPENASQETQLSF